MSEAKCPVPSGLKLTALDPEFRENPSGPLAVLRSEEPVHKDRTFDRVILTRAKDVAATLNDRTLAVDPRKSRPGSVSWVQFRVDKGFRPTMLHLDDPDHRRLRGLVAKAFNVRSIENMRGRINEIAHRLLDAVAGRASFDVVEAYAKPLPTIVIATMLGVDESDQINFKRWSDDRAHIFNPARTPDQQAAVDRAQEEFTNYLLKVIEERRKNRGSDLISALINAEEGGERLTVPEIVSTCHILLIAGNLTTTDLLSNGVLILLQHPDQLARIRQRPALINPAVEELLRHSPPLTQMERIPLETHTIDGVTVEPGQTISNSLFAANHDPALHADPDVFDIERADKSHYSFGGGTHFCIGAPLARAEAQIGLWTLFERFPRLQLHPDRPPVRKAVPAFNGHDSLWVQSEPDKSRLI
jgi:cytochrome P450